MKRKCLAIPIRCHDYSNSSQVVCLFTREAGLVEGLAKGAHRERNPFQGPFDLAVLYEVVFFERRGPGLSLLTEGAVLDGLRGLRQHWDRHLAGSHVLEFLRAVTVAGEPSGELFDLARATLQDLTVSRGIRVETLLVRFDLMALKILGLFAPVCACVACSRGWPRDDRPVFFSVRAGGLLCGRCHQLQPQLEGSYLPGAAVRELYLLANGAPASLDLFEAEASLAFRGEVARTASALRTNLLERDLGLLKSSVRWV